ncbi:MAG: hypothetical protein WA813_26820 [Beijerinckiaceae bacterium]
MTLGFLIRATCCAALSISPVASIAHGGPGIVTQLVEFVAQTVS